MNDFLQCRIEATQRLIVAHEQAAEALIAGGVESYTLDTGQSRQTVTRLDVDKIQEMLDTLYNRYNMLCARAGITNNTSNGRPIW